MQPWNLDQALTTCGFFMALNSFLILLINSSLILHGILLVHLSIAPHTKKLHRIQVRQLQRPNVRGGQNQQSCRSAKIAFFLMYGRVPSFVATHMACQQPPYISRAVRASPKPSGTPPC